MWTIKSVSKYIARTHAYILECSTILQYKQTPSIVFKVLTFEIGQFL